MKYPEREVASVADLLRAMSQERPDGRAVWYRGQTNADWRLLSSIARHPQAERELTLFKRFKQNALQFIPQRPEDDWEWLFVMQHHQLPTRLMDWTESPLVALYFAVENDAQGAQDAALWSLAPFELNEASGFIATHDYEIPAFGDDNHLDSYLPTSAALQRMALGPVAAIGLRNNLRIQAQQGVFTVSMNSPTPLDDGDPPYLWRYRIPSAAKQNIRRELALLNIGKLALFPELTNVALHAVDL